MPASGIAILYRINAQSEVYEKALSDAGVPYLVRGGERFFARPEVRQAHHRAAGRAPLHGRRGAAGPGRPRSCWARSG